MPDEAQSQVSGASPLPNGDGVPDGALPMAGDETVVVEAQTGSRGTNTGKNAADSSVGVVVFACLFWGAIILGSVWSSEGGRAFLIRWQRELLFGLAIAASLLIALGVWRWFHGSDAQRRTGVIVFVFLPALLFGIGAIALLPPARQVVALRSVFLIVVCLLPALIYYLFIATRKFSLLNDYFINLNRLGLLTPCCHDEAESRITDKEAEVECRVRLLNYLQKFEALYGPVPADLQKEIVEASNPLSALARAAERPKESSGLVQIFSAETAIPVIVATVLIALGWLLALPPFGVDASQFGKEAVTKSDFWSMFFNINEDPIAYVSRRIFFSPKCSSALRMHQDSQNGLRPCRSASSWR
jgi:hypothetical protein